LGESGFLGECCVVAVAMLVEGDDEVVNGFGLGRALAKDNTRASEAGTAMSIVSGRRAAECLDASYMDRWWA